MRAVTWEQALGHIRDCTTEVASPELCGEPLVSVSIVTYQHSGFIEQSVRSVLEQRTDFPFEVLVGDDGSTDGTTEIVRRLQAEHGDRMRLFESEPNLGGFTGTGRLNLIRNLVSARGKYIALLDGDDYWSDPEKLARQVAGLRSHPECGAVAHRTEIEWEGEDPAKTLFCRFEDGQILGVSDVLTTVPTPFHTSSFMFEAERIEVVPHWLLNAIFFDRAIYVYCATRKPILFLGESMSLHRKHGGGITNSSGFKTLEARLDRLQLVVDMGADLRLGRVRKYRRVYLSEMRASAGHLLRSFSLSGLWRWLRLGGRGIRALLRGGPRDGLTT